MLQNSFIYGLVALKNMVNTNCHLGGIWEGVGDMICLPISTCNMIICMSDFWVESMLQICSNLTTSVHKNWNERNTLPNNTHSKYCFFYGFFFVFFFVSLVARVCYCLFLVCCLFGVSDIWFVISTFTPIFFIEVFVLLPPPHQHPIYLATPNREVASQLPIRVLWK